jgi:imidazolonepropionase
LIDCHTHLVFGGSRAREFEMRLQGVSYQEIAAQGGGIVSTVKATREASEEALFVSAKKRLNALYNEGVTTVEIKSGYGLEEDTELKQLRVANWLKSLNLADIVVTFMGAHAFPENLNKYEYVSEVIRMLPLVKDLADFCDVFCEEGAFTVDESREILEAAKSLGFKLKIHADEFGDTGGGRLGAEIGVVTADHLAGSSLSSFIVSNELPAK